MAMSYKSCCVAFTTTSLTSLLIYFLLFHKYYLQINYTSVVVTSWRSNSGIVEIKLPDADKTSNYTAGAACGSEGACPTSEAASRSKSYVVVSARPTSEVARSSGCFEAVAAGKDWPIGTNSRRWNVPPVGTLSTILDGPANACEGGATNISMVIGIVSAPSEEAERAATRQKAWFNGTATFPVLSVFLLGTSGSSTTQERIALESSRFGDIVQQDFSDTFQNLNYKVLMGMNWTAVNCPRATWFMRLNIAHIDVDLGLIERHTILTKLGQTKDKGTAASIMCPQVRPPELLCRNSTGKYYVSFAEYPEPLTPTFCEGTSYVVPVARLQDFVSCSRIARYHWPEDVFISGMLRTLIKNLDINRLDYEYNRIKI